MNTTSKAIALSLAMSLGWPISAGAASAPDDEALRDLVYRAYPYIAMYNVNNKFALKQGGWNSCDVNTELLDHETREIARPNNDSLYISCMVDVTAEPMVLEIPAIDSKYVSLMVTGYDHYVNIPLSTRQGDFGEPVTMLLYSERTAGYDGAPVEGVEKRYELTGDFVSAVFRVMPHANDPDRFARIKDEMQGVSLMTLSEFRGKDPKPHPDPGFPPVAETDTDLIAERFLPVMQFIANHTTFHADDPIDQALLERLASVGVVPGQAHVADSAPELDADRLRKITDEIRSTEFARGMDPTESSRSGPAMFQPKGNIPVDVLVLQSVMGPIGQPNEEAIYLPIAEADGTSLNAQHDYVIRMPADQMPPALAFWSLTLYESATGFFIPNERKKYSVGENAGMVLDENGGLEVWIAADSPEGVPQENWLPITREDLDLDVILRIYVPDLEAMKEWTPPAAERVGG